MNLQSLVVVILRLMSLNFFLQAAIQLTPQLLQMMNMFRSSRSDETDSLIVFSWLLIFGLMVGAVLFWVFAPAIARFVTRGVSQEISFGSVSLVDCYSIAFIGIGLFYIASHFPQVLNWSHYLFKAAASTPGDSWKEGLRGYDISQAFIPFIIGIILFVNGRKWALKLANKQIKNSETGNPV